VKEWSNAREEKEKKRKRKGKKRKKKTLPPHSKRTHDLMAAKPRTWAENKGSPKA
jgi:hypothetical protein